MVPIRRSSDATPIARGNAPLTIPILITTQHAAPRLLFRVREREHAAVISGCQVTSSGSRNLPVAQAAQPGTDVMRDVLRLVDVDLLQNCNGRSTIAQADDLLKRVVTLSFDMVVCLSDMTSCPVEWQPSEAAFEAEACRPIVRHLRVRVVLHRPVLTV